VTDPGGPAPVEHLDVLVVGAGLSGIGAAHHLQASCPWASYAIFEARGAIGGTWDLFRYPGIRSDSDMFTLGYGFRPWDGEKSIAAGADILRYIADTAAAEGIEDKIRFHHRITRAAWSTDDARWHVTAERADTGETVELTCSFLFSCSGYYRYDRGYLPEWDGLADFGGQLVHPQFWPEDLDVEGKKVVVIGSGATAITLVPSLAPQAGHVTMLQRSPTYVMALPTTDPTANLLRKLLPPKVSGPIIRWQHALVTQGFFRLSRRRPQLVKKLLRKGLERMLPKGYDIDTHFTPTYDPWDQRLCVVADGDLFREIHRGRASVVTDHIERFDEAGIVLRSGERLDADVVVAATGLELLFLGGIELTVDGEPVVPAERLSYKGMMLEGVPNLAMAIGYTNASWTLKAELTFDAVARLLNHLRERGLRQATPVDVEAGAAQRTGDSVLPLQSGYIQRAAGLLPRQGDRFPWQVHQSYLADWRAMKRKPIDDGVMRFSNPRPRAIDRARAVADDQLATATD
jgi:cation diffusion facilitator CzcD-associated flavoprotein CzcO